MLRKIIAIKNVGRFLNSAAAGDVEFKRRTLVFAENARGKTTLCAILRSFQSGDPAFIVGRTTLRGTGTPQVSLLLDVGTVTFGRGAWSATEPLIDIFDSTFIAQNVYSGDAIDLIHRRNLYGVIVGDEGVRLAKRVEELDKASREKSTEIRVKRAAVEAYVPQTLTLDAFISLPTDPDIDHKITQKEVELEAANQSDQINSHAALTELVLPFFPRGFQALLSKTIAGVAEDAAKLVSEQISKHEMHQRGESWLSEGLTFVRDDSCPFCGQSIDGNELLAAYTVFFGQAYKALHSEILGTRQFIENSFSDREIAQAERTLDQNTSAREFWSRYCEFTPPSVDIRAAVPEILRSLRQAALARLETKLASPLTSIEVGLEFPQAWEKYEELEGNRATYNRDTQSINAVIEAKKAATSRVNLASIQNNLNGLRAVKARRQQAVDAICQAYSAALQEKQALDQEKARVKEELEANSTNLMARFEEAINRHLDDFQVGFRISGTKHAYPGGVASSTFQIIINDAPVELGDSNTPLDRPSFKNTLSSGDRNTLALAFFLARLENDPSLAQRIVVFDDPFNSQDRFRKQRTIQKIRVCGDTSQQLIVFSHDREFLKLLWDRLGDDAANRTCLRLARIGVRDTRVSSFDLEQAVMSQSAVDLKALVDFYNGGQAQPLEIVRKIRPILETHCRNLYPGDFANDTLGTIIDKIRDQGAGPQLLPVLADLEALNVYTRTYHHGENPDVPDAPIDDAELQAFVGRTLAIVGGG